MTASTIEEAIAHAIEQSQPMIKVVLPRRMRELAHDDSTRTTPVSRETPRR